LEPAIVAEGVPSMPVAAGPGLRPPVDNRGNRGKSEAEVWGRTAGDGAGVAGDGQTSRLGGWITATTVPRTFTPAVTPVVTPIPVGGYEKVKFTVVQPTTKV
jgi:hypothetical protein